jgi:hypothetical protein
MNPKYQNQTSKKEDMDIDLTMASIAIGLWK